MRKTLQEQAQTAIEEKHKALLIKNQMENNSDLLDGLVHISGQLEVLSSSTEPRPSVLKAYSNPKDFLDKDILSEAIIEMDRWEIFYYYYYETHSFCLSQILY